MNNGIELRAKGQHIGLILSPSDKPTGTSQRAISHYSLSRV